VRDIGESCPSKGEGRSYTPPLVNEKAPFRETQKSGTKKDSSGDGQQQFIELGWK
jgi:hypothetical protein